MAEKTPAPAPDASSQTKKVLGRLDLLEKVVPKEEVEQLRIFLSILTKVKPDSGPDAGKIRASALPQPPSPALSVDTAPLKAKARVIQEMLDEEEMQRIVSGLEEVLDTLQKNPDTPSKERLSLLLDIVNPKLKELMEEYLKLKEETGALTTKVTLDLRTKIGLPETADGALRNFLTIGWGPDRLPPEPTPELTQRHKDLKGRFDDIARRMSFVLTWTADETRAKDPGLKNEWLKYQTAVEQFERDAIEQGKKSFMKDVGFAEDMKPADFDAMLREVTKPVDLPSSSRDVKLKDDPKRLADVTKVYDILEDDRKAIVRKVDSGLLFRPLSKEDREQWVKEFTEYLLKRDLYDRKLLKKDSSTSKLLLYAGVVVNELGEEVAEDLFKFSKKSLYERYALKIPFIQALDAGARTNLLAGWEKVVNGLKARGVPAETMGKVFGFMNRSPVGPKFWGELLKVQSPLTVVLWGMFMYQAEDKTKAAIQFGSFIAMSKGSNKLLELAEEGCRDSAARSLKKARAIADPLKRAEAIEKATKYSDKMKGLSKIPGNPAVKFAAAIGLAIGLSSTVDAVAGEIDKAIPDSETKHYLEVGLSIVSTEALIGHTDELLYEVGAFKVNPMRDQLQFLGAENIFVTEEEGIDRMRFHTIEDWNKRVDQAIQAERDNGPKANVVAINLFQLQKIDDPVKWAERQSVVLYSQSNSLKASETQLGATLKERGVIDNPTDLNAWAIAVADDGDKRNDRELDYALGVGKNSPGLLKAKKFFEGEKNVPKDDPLRTEWNEYLQLAKDIARNVSIFRNLGLYNKTEWLGDPAKVVKDGEERMPEKVQRGMLEELVFRSKWNIATDRKSYPQLRGPEFQKMLDEALRMRAEDPGWNKMVSTGVTLGGTYAAYRLFSAMGKSGRFAQTTFGQFLQKIPGGTTLNGARRMITYPATRVLFGPTPDAPAAPGTPEAPRKLTAANPEVEAKLRALEKDGRLSRAAADNIRRSPSAQKIMDGALKTNNVGELDRCVRSANRAVTLTRTMAAAGMAADAFGAYMAFVAYQELEGKINATDNPALQDVYKGMQTQEVRVGTFSGVCFVINGIAFVTGGAGTVGGLAAACTPVLLPLTLAVLGGKYASDRLYEVAETWSKNGLDWAKELGPTEIMRKLIELAPGEPNFWQEVGVIGAQMLDSVDGTPQTRGDTRDFYTKAAEKKEVANHMTRVALLHAYFINTLKLQPATNEPEDAFKKRADVAISDAMRYMLIRAGDQVTGSALDDALTHAILCDKARQLKQKKAKGELDEPEVLVWKGPDGKDIKIDLSEYEESVALSTKGNSPKIPAGTAIREYRKSVNGSYASFLNNSKPKPAEKGPDGKVIKPAEKMTEANLRFTQLFIQNQLMERLEPYIYRLRGKLFEYYDGVSVTDMSNLGKKELLQYVLYQQIRFKLASSVQALLIRPEPATAEDIESIFQSMVADLVPNEGMNRKFDALLAQSRKMNVDAINGPRFNANPLTPQNLRRNLIWNTSSPEFQEFALAHPWLVSDTVVSADMYSTVFVLDRFITDQLQQFRMNNFRVSREADFRFLMSYADMLDKNPDYDPDGSARALIRSLNKKEFNWTGSSSVFEQYTTDRSNAFIDVVKKLKKHVETIDRARNYFNKPDRNKPVLNNVAVVGAQESGYNSSGENDHYVAINGYEGGDIRVTVDEGLKGKELRDEKGKLVGVMRCERKQYQQGGPTFVNWRLDTSTAETTAKFYIFTKGAYNNQPFDYPGVEVVSRSAKQIAVPIGADGSMTIDTQFYYERNAKSEGGYGKAYTCSKWLDIQITQTDGKVINAKVAIGYHTDKDGKLVPDTIIYDPATKQNLAGYRAEYLLSTGTGRPAIKLIPADPKGVKEYKVTFQSDTFTAKAPDAAEATKVPSYILSSMSFVRYMKDYANGRAEPINEIMDGTEITVYLEGGTIVKGRVKAVREGTKLNMTYEITSVQVPGAGGPKPLAESALAPTLKPDFLEVLLVNVPSETPGKKEFGIKIGPKPDSAKVTGYEVKNPKSGYQVKGRVKQ